MKATVVVLALVATLGASTASADSIDSIGMSMYGGGSPSAISDFTISGNTITFNLMFGLSNPIFLMVDGLDARTNYQVEVNVQGPAEWTEFTAEILNPMKGGGNADDPSPQPGYVPAGFSTSTDYDGFSFAQGTRMERGFIAAGGSAFGVFADELSDARDMLTFSGLGTGPATVMFGLRDFGGGRAFLIRLVGVGRDAVATPEPASLLLVGGGLVALARAARKRRTQS
ncbi:MAG TPA: PEP-CTERM sorting domain-containing protein [Vicinamibacterales bacterium]|jgi:hypothetical protein|nr:PEP-CTERM sorting domain-containing protein [Vicinamibacterales bacterium]